MNPACTCGTSSDLPHPSQSQETCSLQVTHIDKGVNSMPQFLHEPLLNMKITLLIKYFTDLAIL